MLADHRTWALVDDAGYLVEVYEDAALGVAMATAERRAHGPVVLDSRYDIGVAEETLLAANPRRLPVEASLRATHLPVVEHRAVTAMSVEEAHERLLPYFPTRKRQKGRWVRITQWQSVRGMVENLLRVNQKTGKRHPERRDLVATGLSLAPNAIAFQRMGVARSPDVAQSQGEQSIRGGTLCVGSNSFCRASCLVYSGQNTADPYNNELKIATTVALLREPVAFMRMLIEAIRFVKQDREVDCNQTACFRLNVFSDVPWELVYPRLFREFKDTQFYDYTKVSGRDTPTNYDLTFSFSGTNWGTCRLELEKHGRRVAVVFVASRMQDYPLPESYRGYEVIDGTTHDFRFTDPQGLIVGLRYKAPNTELLAHSASFMGKALQARNFLVPCWTEDGVVVAAETPRAAEAFWYDFEVGEEARARRPKRRRR